MLSSCMFLNVLFSAHASWNSRFKIMFLLNVNGIVPVTSAFNVDAQKRLLKSLQETIFFP